MITLRFIAYTSEEAYIACASVQSESYMTMPLAVYTLQLYTTVCTTQFPKLLEVMEVTVPRAAATLLLMLTFPSGSCTALPKTRSENRLS